MKTIKKTYFTLIELLVVIAILIILAGMTLAAAMYLQNKALNDTAKTQIQLIKQAMTGYSQDWGFYPPVSVDGVTKSYLDALIDPDGRKYINWDQKGFRSNSADIGNGITAYYMDPWDNPYFIECPGTMNQQTFDVWSMGQDGEHGNGGGGTVSDVAAAQVSDPNNDDICSWKSN